MPGIHDPLNTASGTGIAEEFREPLGYETATTGQPFLKIGVGLLEKPWNNVFFSEPYKILQPAEWKISQGKDYILFEKSISSDSGYAYRYSKRISLLPGSRKYQFHMFWLTRGQNRSFQIPIAIIFLFI